MKKVLFATTALVATAGVAAADVTFGGYGRFGVLYNEAKPGDETNVTSRFRLQIDATAETDNGVVVGARARLQQDNTDENIGTAKGKDGIYGTSDDILSENGPAGTGLNGIRFFARSGGFEVGVGNIFGALDAMPGMYPIDLGLTGLGYQYTAYGFQGDGYSSGGSGSAGENGVEVMYAAGDLSVHVSYSDHADRSDTSGVIATEEYERLAAHVAYTWNGWTFAVGGQDSDKDSDTEFAVSAGGSFGVADVTLAYADNGTKGDRTVLAGRFDVGAATNVEVYVADQSGAGMDTGYGIDFNHDLGGGVSLRGGVAHMFDGSDRADMGVRFNF